MCLICTHFTWISAGTRKDIVKLLEQLGPSPGRILEAHLDGSEFEQGKDDWQSRHADRDNVYHGTRQDGIGCGYKTPVPVVPATYQHPCAPHDHVPLNHHLNRAPKTGPKLSVC